MPARRRPRAAAVAPRRRRRAGGDTVMAPPPGLLGGGRRRDELRPVIAEFVGALQPLYDGEQADKTVAARARGAATRFTNKLRRGEISVWEAEEAGLLPAAGAVEALRARVRAAIGARAEAAAFEAGGGYVSGAAGRYAAVVAEALLPDIGAAGRDDAATAAAHGVAALDIKYEEALRGAALRAAGLEKAATEMVPCPRCGAPDTLLDATWGRLDNPLNPFNLCGGCGHRWRTR